MLNALNEVLRDDFIRDSESGVGRWNRIIEKAGLEFRLVLPHKAFNRQIGTLSGNSYRPGRAADFKEEWDRRWRARLRCQRLRDRVFVTSLMKAEREPGKYAGWIAAPSRAINKQPLDLEYVRFN